MRCAWLCLRIYVCMKLGVGDKLQQIITEFFVPRFPSKILTLLQLFDEFSIRRVTNNSALSFTNPRLQQEKHY